MLPAAESIEACLRIGIPQRNIIAAWGPFSRELNLAFMNQFDIGMLVTKESGKEGGFEEKAEAARIRGCRLVIIRRPSEDGVSFEELLRSITDMSTICKKEELIRSKKQTGSERSKDRS